MKQLSVALVLLFASLSISAQSAKPKPSLDLPDLNGKRISLTNYHGKVVLLNFWATWCAPCRQEIPDLIKLQRTYQNRGLQIIGITYPPEKTTEVQQFARRYRVNYPIALGNKETKNALTDSETLPMSVVLDTHGDVSAVIEGIMYPDEFDEKVKPLLLNRPSRESSTIQRANSKRSKEQTATIVVGAAGYQPASVSLRRGIPAQLTFIRNIEQSCGRDIVIPAYGINRPLPLNQPVMVRFTPKRSGRYKFTCGMNMFRGALIVK